MRLSLSFSLVHLLEIDDSEVYRRGVTERRAYIYQGCIISRQFCFFVNFIEKACLYKVTQATNVILPTFFRNKISLIITRDVETKNIIYRIAFT